TSAATGVARSGPATTAGTSWRRTRTTTGCSTCLRSRGTGPPTAAEGLGARAPVPHDRRGVAEERLDVALVAVGAGPAHGAAQAGGLGEGMDCSRGGGCVGGPGRAGG